MRHDYANANCDSDGYAYTDINTYCDSYGCCYGYSDSDGDGDSHVYANSYAYGNVNSDVRAIHDQPDNRQYRARHDRHRQSRG